VKPACTARPYVVLALLGAALLFPAAQRLRIDLEPCIPMMSAARWLYMGSFALAVLFLSVAWAGLAGLFPGVRPLRLSQVLGLLLAVHGMALLSPPFLSDDPLAYAAVGHAMAAHQMDAATPLGAALAAGDPFLHRVSAACQAVGSSYGPAFNHLSKAVAQLGGEQVAVQLRLYQLLAALCVLGAAVLAALSARTSKDSGGAAAALIGLCPLSVIEGTVNAHNDALLLFLTTLFVWLRVKGHPLLALAALGAGLFIKLGAALLLGPALLFVAQQRLGLKLSRRAGLALGLSGLLLSAAALTLLRPHLLTVSSLLGGAEVPYDYCTRSVECLPRVLLRFVAHAPRAAWGVGLLFRLLGAAWFLYITWRAAKEGRLLKWAAAGLFIYYLYLHPWAQSWYLLSLLPLMPYAARRLQPAMYALCISAVAYYTVANDCLQEPVAVAVNNLTGAAITILPPSLLLWQSRAGGPYYALAAEAA
jgi:hypothetical protein